MVVMVVRVCHRQSLCQALVVQAVAVAVLSPLVGQAPMAADKVDFKLVLERLEQLIKAAAVEGVELKSMVFYQTGVQVS